jgi:hypothetical protein
MSDLDRRANRRRRWLSWQPSESIMADSAKPEPTKPSEPGFDGFDGSSSSQATEIEVTRSDRNSQESSKFQVDLSTGDERLMSWAEWKAGALNQLFLELGNASQPGRITPDTIRHGERRG